MNRALGYALLAVALAATVTANFVTELDPESGWPTVAAVPSDVFVSKGLLAVAVLAGTYGLYVLAQRALVRPIVSKRRAHDARNVFRLVLGSIAIIGLLGVLTEQWVGVLFSLGIVGFAVTFAL